MADMLLPDLDKLFCNFELGLDAEHVCVTGVEEDQYQILKQSIPSDTEYQDDIKADHVSESTSIPPNIDITTTDPTHTSLQMPLLPPIPPIPAQPSPTPTPIPTPTTPPTPPLIPKRPPQVVASLAKRRRKRNKRETASTLCNTNNPNPGSSKYQTPTVDQYKAKYKKCPWSQINIQRGAMSYDPYMVVI